MTTRPGRGGGLNRPLYACLYAPSKISAPLSVLFKSQVLDHEAGRRTTTDEADPLAVPARMSAHWRPAPLPEGMPADVPFSGGWVGFTSYDSVRYAYPAKLPLSKAPPDDRKLPDIHLSLYRVRGEGGGHLLMFGPSFSSTAASLRFSRPHIPPSPPPPLPLFRTWWSSTRPPNWPTSSRGWTSPPPPPPPARTPPRARS